MAQPTEFPKGFKFGYNNRRGDPQFTPYWWLEHNGEVVAHFHEGLDYPNTAAVKAAALEAASRIANRTKDG